jgi:methyl-accepting chemotaxis protein
LESPGSEAGRNRHDGIDVEIIIQQEEKNIPMPTSMTEHADFIWMLLVGAIALIGTVASIASAGWSRAGKLQVELLKTGQDELKINQRDLSKSISKVHERIDGVCQEIATVDSKASELKGRTDSLEKIYNRIELRMTS